MTQQIHLVVATPCFGGQVSSIYASPIFRLQRTLRCKSNVDLKSRLGHVGRSVLHGGFSSEFMVVTDAA